MKTLNEIFASTKTAEECEEVLSMLLETADYRQELN